MTNPYVALLFPILAAACSSPSPSTTSNPPSGNIVRTIAPVSSAPPTIASSQQAQNAPKQLVKPKAEKLAVKRIVLARGIENKEPREPSTTFNAKESRIYAFLEVENPETLPGEVSVSFAPPSGKPTAEVRLAVGEGARWRTWAFTRQAHEAGEWTAIVKDTRGHELGRQTFNVEL